MKTKISKALKAALKHYPELKDTNITLKEKNSKYIMHILPIFSSVFKRKRKYQIIITKNQNKEFLNHLTQKEIEGWIGHELAHALEYQAMPAAQIIGFGLEYSFNPKIHKKTERRIDAKTIKRGLGKELKQGVIATFNSNDISKKYKDRLKKYYLSPKEIQKKLDKFKSNRRS